MCNAYNLRHGAEAILDIARAMRCPISGLSDFPPWHRIWIKQRGLILRPNYDGALVWSWAKWSLVPPGAKEPPAYPLSTVRSNQLTGWPWKTVAHRRCLIPVSGFWEPEKLARASGSAPWSYYSMRDDRPFFVAGFWSDAVDPRTREMADSYAMIIGAANAVMRVHDRMPAILGTDAARRWLEPGPLPAELLVPYPAEEMQAWRVSNDAKSSWIEPHAGMAEPVPEAA